MLENRPGTYLIQFYTEQTDLVQVGRLGNMQLRRGYYCYVGSAFGPGGVRARVKHHLKVSSRPHWHLDYVRPFLQPQAVWFCYEQRKEHAWAQALVAHMSIPMVGFGASDCDCETHFFHIAKKPQLIEWQTEWSEAIASREEAIRFYAVP